MRYTWPFRITAAVSVPLTELVFLVPSPPDNPYLRHELRGYSLSVAVSGVEVIVISRTSALTFPPLVVQMLSVGEESGQLDDLLRRSFAVLSRGNRPYWSGSLPIEPILISFACLPWQRCWHRHLHAYGTSNSCSCLVDDGALEVCRVELIGYVDKDIMSVTFAMRLVRAVDRRMSAEACDWPDAD